MSLEQALAENTAAVLALTKALTAGAVGKEHPAAKPEPANTPPTAQVAGAQDEKELNSIVAFDDVAKDFKTLAVGDRAAALKVLADAGVPEGGRLSNVTPDKLPGVWKAIKALL